MLGADGVAVGVKEGDAVLKTGLKILEKGRLKSIFHRSRSRLEDNDAGEVREMSLEMFWENVK